MTIAEIFTALISCTGLALLTVVIVLTVKDYREFNRQRDETDRPDHT